jgi:hypothetical protein
MRNQKFLKFSARRTEWPTLPATEQESNIWMHKKRGGTKNWKWWLNYT